MKPGVKPPMSQPTRSNAESPAARQAQPVVYVLPSDSVTRPDDTVVDFAGLWETLWGGRWFIGAITALFAAAAVAYGLIAVPWYRAEVLLAPAETRSTSALSADLSGLGSLASLAGITVGSGTETDALAVLTSREFTRAFIVDYNLLPVLFSDKWDARAGGWNSSDPQKQPDIYDGIKYFDENVMRVREDKKTNLVTLTVEWKNPRIAADWANELVKRLNERMRQRAQEEADSSVKYLKEELAAASVVNLQQSISRLLDSELQKAMIARVNQEFAFRVIDRADAPKWRSRPARVQLAALATVIGLILSSFFVLIRNGLRTNRAGRHEPASKLQI